MLRRIAASSIVFAAAVSFFACSSSSSNNNGGLAACGSGGGPVGGSSNTPCDTCTNNKCASQEQTCLNGACSAWINAGCKGAPDQGCQDCAATIEQCQHSSCASECHFSTDAGPTSDGGGGPNCAALSTCCNDPAMPAEQKGPCTNIVTYGDDSTCKSALSGYQGAGYCKGS